MSKIKLRAWDSVGKRWLTSSEFLKLVYIRSDGLLTFLIETIKMVQFTGMLDKNRHEIYEGDIIANGSSRRTEVKFGSFYASDLAIVDGHEWENSGRAMAWSINEDDASHGEIVGNMYENPEMVKSRAKQEGPKLRRLAKVQQALKEGEEG